eukprot:scaffold20.g7746.t1
MGKNDFLTPKAIANRIKAKGLQKLRWYCQMCQKQCRDENGFKCHLTSDGHKRQMEVFGQNPGRVIAGYTEEFEKTFLEHLRRCHPFSRVSANVVYNEYINDRHHIHMNSTRWLTLTEFVKYLGREGLCKVDETPKGWYITYIHKDDAEVGGAALGEVVHVGLRGLGERELAGKKRSKRERAELAEEERHKRALEEQIERARLLAGDEEGAPADEGATELRRDEGEQPLGFSLSTARVAAAREREEAAAAAAAHRPAAAFDEGGEEAGPSGRPDGGAPPPAKRSKLEELMEKDRQAKAAAAARAAGGAGGTTGAGTTGGAGRAEAWLAQGIVVKVLSKALKEHGYYKQKGVVLRVVDRYVGEIEMLDSGDIVRVDQAELETVIPQPGGNVLVLGGPHRGARGTLREIDTGRFQARVELRDGTKVWLDYEELSRFQALGK